jgi:hypothetical protein
MANAFMLEVTCRILGAWAILVGAGWLADAPQWAIGGPLGRDLDRLHSARWTKWRLFDLFHHGQGLALLGLLQAGLGVWLVFSPGAPLIALVLLGLIIAMQALRRANDGADKLAMVVITGSILQAIGLALDQPLLTLAGTLWIGGQLTLAYATSGFAKLRHAVWRNGVAVQAALSSYAFGCGWSAWLVRRAGPARLLAWAVMLPEILFPFALLLPAGWLAAVLGLFLLFHLSTAAAMGLSTYPLAFVAAYPSTLMLGHWLRIQTGMQ